jgi:hypothetical protein
MKANLPTWTMPDLHRHLQYAVDLELFTIPFYLSAMHSIKISSKELAAFDKDPDAHKSNVNYNAYSLIRSVVIEEMLHLELAANLNKVMRQIPLVSPAAYNYNGTVPHINEAMDHIPPVLKASLSPADFKIGPCDLAKVNAMALVELPEDRTGLTPDLQPSTTEYGSIGLLYDAVHYGIDQLWGQLVSDIVLPQLTAQFTGDFAEQHLSFNPDHPTGFSETIISKDDAFNAIQAIVEQGEGAGAGTTIASPDRPITPAASDPGFYDPASSHYQKFLDVKTSGLPQIYTGGGSAPTEQAALDVAWDKFKTSLQTWFSDGGAPPSTFFGDMYGIGPAIQTVWAAGATPVFN